MREALARRPRAEHLRERGVASSLEAQPLDDPDRERGNLHDHLAQDVAGHMKHAAVDGRDTGPDVNALGEDVGASDEISRMPISERYLAPGRSDIENPDAARLDEIDAVLGVALAEHLRAAIENPSLTAADDVL